MRKIPEGLRGPAPQDHQPVSVSNSTPWNSNDQHLLHFTLNQNTPNDEGLSDLLRRVILVNVPLLYYYNSDAYVIIHPNLPPLPTTA